MNEYHEGSSEHAKKRLINKINTILTDCKNTLIEAPTSLGKSHYIATTEWLNYPDLTDGEPVVHLHQTKKARDEAINASEEAEVDYAVLKSRNEQCGTARGDYDDELTAPNGGNPSEWFNQKCDKQGYEFSRVHSRLEDELGRLPCQQDGECGGQDQWSGVPRNQDGEPEYDIIHATHQFARINPLIENANVIIDEQPDYSLKLEHDDLRQAVISYLDRVAPKQKAWPTLTAAITNENNETLAEYQDLLDGVSDKRPLLTSEESHRLVPTITRALASAEPATNDRYTGEDGRTTVVIDSNGEKKVIRRQPAFSEARCVIGLDAHPSKRLWESNIGIDLQHMEVLAKRERQEWRRNERGLQVVQMGNYTRSLTTGWWNNSTQNLQAKAIVGRLRHQYGSSFRTCITASRVEDDLRKMMRDEGIENPNTMHYGEQSSRNDFTGEKVGLLIGCIDPGDEYVLDMLAEQRLEARPEIDDTENGEERAYGRGFVGPDADAANEFLESVRANNVAQGIGRYARERMGSEDVTVYVWTDAVPKHLVDEEVPGITGNITDAKLSMLKMARKEGPVTTRMVSEETEWSQEHIRQSFNQMVEQDALTVSKGSGKYGADEYDATGKSLLPGVDIAKSGRQEARI